MAKNIELNFYNGSSYEVLYPKTSVMLTQLSYTGSGKNNTIFLSLNLNSSLYAPFMALRFGLFLSPRVCLLSGTLTQFGQFTDNFIWSASGSNLYSFIYMETIYIKNQSSIYSLQISPIQFIYSTNSSKTPTDYDLVQEHGDYSGQSYNVLFFYTNK